MVATAIDGQVATVAEVAQRAKALLARPDRKQGPRMSVLSDKEARFIAALRRRDERAFTILVTRYEDRVFNLIYRMLNNREEARDVAQDVFVSIFEKIDSYRGDAKISTWVYRVAANHAKNRVKYLARRHDRKRDNFEDMHVQPTEGRISAAIPRPDQAAEATELSEFLQRTLATLDEEQRLVIVLRDIEGHSYDVISQITGLNLGTVKSRLHRGRLKMKEALERWRAGAVTRGGTQ